MNYVPLSILLIAFSVYAGKKTEPLRITQLPLKPKDLHIQDSLSELKLFIRDKQYRRAAQLLKNVYPSTQIEYMNYLLSEVQCDFLVSGKDDSFQVMYPRNISKNFMKKRIGIRNFFNYFYQQAQKNKSILLPELKQLKSEYHYSVFEKEGNIISQQ